MASHPFTAGTTIIFDPAVDVLEFNGSAFRSGKLRARRTLMRSRISFPGATSSIASSPGCECGEYSVKACRGVETTYPRRFVSNVAEEHGIGVTPT
jgi:hypothetical protein